MTSSMQELYILLLILASVLAFINLVIGLRMHRRPGRRMFVWLMAGVVLWCVGSFIDINARTVDGKMFGCQIAYFGIASIPLNWFLFILQHLKQDGWLTRRRLVVMWIIPVLTFVLIWTNAWHHLMYTRIILMPTSYLTLSRILHGPWFIVHIVYSWLLVLVGMLLLLVSLHNIAPFYRRQTISFMVIALLPSFFNILYVLHWGPSGNFDFTPIAFAVSGAGMLLALRYFRIIDLSPVARKAVFESMFDAVLVLDNRCRILDTNTAFCVLLGKPLQDLFGVPVISCFAEWLPEGLFVTDGGVQTAQLKDSNGNVRWFNLRVSPLPMRHGWLLVMHDITELHQLQEELNKMAFYDMLTGLPNRVLARDRMLQEFSRVRRQQSRMAIMYLDVDGFKEINDSLGHDVGDDLLQQIARSLLSCVRECDTVARIGGDEFILIISDLSNPEYAHATAVRILATCSEAFQLGGHSATITVSIGVALAPDDGMDVDILLSKADSAMYQAKKQGKNTYVFFGELVTTPR